MTRNKERPRGTKPLYQLKTARERITILISQAVSVHEKRPDLSRRYFQLAKRIGMRYNVRIPREMKRKFCKHCFSFMAEGWRLKSGRMTVTCKNCKHVMRYPYKK